MEKEFGYTTGTYAAAAAKAALMVLIGGRPPEEVRLALPDGTEARIPVSSLEKAPGRVTCEVVKRSVEETDVTDNLKILATVSFREDGRIVITGGAGIGRITRRGLQLPVGEAAINPVPRRMIHDSLRELTHRGVDVVISAPDGEKVAASTYNQRLGIVGGISIIGTTGIMRPKSLESFKETILQQLDFCATNGIREIVITPGNISEEAMIEHFTDRTSRERVVQSGDFLGFTLEQAYKRGLFFVLAGHPGKLAKVLAGNFQTHYTKSPPANEAVIRMLRGRVPEHILCEMSSSPTVEGITEVLLKERRTDLLDEVAERIEEKVREYLKTDLSVPVILFNMDKRLIGSSAAARKWIRGSS